jgi:phosphinothricin acetyltransferase
MFNIRFVCENDALGILDIYSPYVSFSSVTFESDVPRPFEMQRRINTITNKYPWLVCEKDGVIAGFAYAQDFFSSEGYSRDVEVSVYIRDDFQRCNIASALYFVLLEILKNQGFCAAFAKITVPNDKSLAFHAAFGFFEAGHLKNAGFKLGEWHDVKILEKTLLDDYSKPPKEIIPISEVNPDYTGILFNKAEKIIRER